MPVSLPWSGEAPDIGAFEGTARHPSETRAIASPTHPRPGQPVTFSIDPMGREVAHVCWDFGDGTRAEGPQVTHAYAKGKYGAIVRARYGNGQAGVDVVFVEVQPPTAADQPMLHCSFEDADIEQWGYLMKFQRQRRTGAERVGGGYRSERCYRIFAENSGAILGACLYPGEWNIDQYPSVRFAYRIPKATPVGLALELYPAAGIDPTTVMVGGTSSRTSGALPDTADYELTDDGKWHETTIDVRAIRKICDGLNHIRGFRFYTHQNARKGQQFSFDEFSVLPAR